LEICASSGRALTQPCCNSRSILPRPPVTSLEAPEIPADVSVVVHAGQHIAVHLPRVHPTRHAICYVRNQTVNHYIDLRGPFSDYLKGFSSKTRSTLQRKIRKIAAIEGASFECRSYSAPDSVREFHRLARQVAVKTYQEKLFDGALPASPEFVEHMRAMAELGCFRGFLLFVKDEPVSYLYLPASGNTVAYGYLGYDPGYASFSPGTVLLYLALEKLFAEQRFHFFNFTYGEGQAKELFGRESFLQADIYFFRRNLRNCVAVYSHIAMDWCSSVIGKMLDVLGLRRALRKLLRRSANTD